MSRNLGGRPTKMTETTLKILEVAFSNGASDLEACFLAEISHTALYKYQREHPEFVSRKEALKEMTKYQAKVLVKKAIFEKQEVEVAQWYLERKGKDEGFSTRTELTGPNGTDLIPKEQVEERLKNLKS